MLRSQSLSQHVPVAGVQWPRVAALGTGLDSTAEGHVHLQGQFQGQGALESKENNALHLGVRDVVSGLPLGKDPLGLELLILPMLYPLLHLAGTVLW